MDNAVIWDLKNYIWTLYVLSMYCTVYIILHIRLPQEIHTIDHTLCTVCKIPKKHTVRDLKCQRKHTVRDLKLRRKTYCKRFKMTKKNIL